MAADLDEVSRADEGRLALERAPTPAGDLIWSAVQAKREAFAREGVGLVADAEDASEAEVDVDPRRLGQVLDNLLANALRHTPPAVPCGVSARRRRRHGRDPVADTGDGMTPDQLAHVFERFYRSDTARDRDRGGSGMGLTISRAIADAHEGSLVADSAGLGHGSTFTLTLPRW